MTNILGGAPPITNINVVTVRRFLRSIKVPKETGLARFGLKNLALCFDRKREFIDSSGRRYQLTVDPNPFPNPGSFVTEVVTNISYLYLQEIYRMLNQNPQARIPLASKITRCPFKERGATLFLPERMLEKGSYLSFYLTSLDQMTSSDQKEVFDLGFALSEGNVFMDTETNTLLADVLANAPTYGEE